MDMVVCNLFFFGAMPIAYQQDTPLILMINKVALRIVGVTSFLVLPLLKVKGLCLIKWEK